MMSNGIAAIGVLAVNLYPFEQTVAKGAARDEVIENIDIGGPSMVRSAAKNHRSVTIVTDPEVVLYDEPTAGLDPRGRRELMAVMDTLENHYRDVQDVEFTVEDGRLFILQTRSAKRTARPIVALARLPLASRTGNPARSAFILTR